MPDCPDCYVTLALSLAGGVCPECLNVYRLSAIQRMPGFDRIKVREAMDILILLSSSGILKPGINKVEFYDDGMLMIDGGDEL